MDGESITEEVAAEEKIEAAVKVGINWSLLEVDARFASCEILNFHHVERMKRNVCCCFDIIPLTKNLAHSLRLPVKEQQRLEFL